MQTKSEMTTIPEFFRNKIILITGATGFLGQALVAKILTDLPDIQKIYLLIRSRTEPNGKVRSAQERLEQEFFTANVFTKLRGMRGNQFDQWIREKVVAVDGDLTYERLGLSDAWYQRLQNEVQLFISSAALVKFDPPIDEAAQFNAISAKDAVEFAKGCNDAIFIHVSTAYVCGNRPGKVAEALHPPFEVYAKQHKELPETLDTEIEDLLQIGKRVRAEANCPEQLAQFRNEARQQLDSGKKKNSQALDKQIENVRNQWVEQRLIDEGLKRALARGWNDTYIYTKALGEQMIVKVRGDLPTAIIRQSIMESSLEEPEPGWLTGSLRMADPIIVGFGKGRLPDFPGDPNSILDVIPVDFVVNAILAVAVQTYHHRGIEVYHVATGSSNPLTFGGIVEATHDYFVEHPLIDKGKPIAVPVWKYPSKKKFQRQLDRKLRLLAGTSWLLDQIPSKWAKQKKRQFAAMQNAIDKLQYYTQIYGPYTRMSFEFESSKTQQLFQSLSPLEKQKFNFDVSRIDWQYYLKEVHIPGIKKHALKLGPASEKPRISKPTSHRIDKPSTDDDSQSEQSETHPPQPRFTTIVDLVAGQAKSLPDRTALQIKRDGEWVRYTYRQVYELSRQVAFSLWMRGYRQDDKVILIAENQPEWGIAYLAVLQIGVIVVPIDHQTPEREILSLAKFTEAKAILTSENLFDRFRTLGTTNTLPEVLNINNACLPFGADLNSTEPIPDDFPSVKIKPDTIASIIFTMGTTVDARGAMLSHKGFIANVLAVSEALPPDETDQFLSVLPLYHALGFSCSFLMSIYAGATVTYINTFKPTTILRTMQETQTTILIGVPRLFKLLYDAMVREVGPSINPEVIEKARATLGGHIRVLVSGGASLPNEVYDGLQQFGLTIYQGYGMTETAPVLSVNPYQKSKRGSVGPAVEGVELQIANPNDDGIGEIVTKSPSMMTGYYRNESATKQVIRDGLLHTGDLGYLDEDGYLYITGRSKNVIVSGTGKNIYPIELEELYRHSSDIAEICVIGITDSSSGEAVHAVIVPNCDGERQHTELEQAIREHLQRCARNLPTHQYLHKVHFWNVELPKTPNFEIDRHLVKERLLEQLSEEPAVPSEATSRTDWTPDSCEGVIVAELARLARLPVDGIHLDSTLDTDLGLDSLMRVELLMLLESKLRRPIPDDIVAEMRTVRNVIQAMQVLNSQTSPDMANISPDPTDKIVQNKNTHKGIKLTGLFRFGMRVIYRRYFSIECKGREHIPHGQACIIAANHTSHLDTPAIMTALGKNAKHLYILGAKDYWFSSSRFKSWFARTCLNILPLDRAGNFLQDVRIAKEALLQGKNLLIYPEGTRSVTGKLQPFKPGLGLLAYESGAPIIPTYIKGTYQALPKGSNLPQKSEIKVIFGKPIICDSLQKRNIDKMDHEFYRAIVAEIRTRIEELHASVDY